MMTHYWFSSLVSEFLRISKPDRLVTWDDGGLGRGLLLSRKKRDGGKKNCVSHSIGL